MKFIMETELTFVMPYTEYVESVLIYVFNEEDKNLIDGHEDDISATMSYSNDESLSDDVINVLTKTGFKKDRIELIDSDYYCGYYRFDDDVEVDVNSESYTKISITTRTNLHQVPLHNDRCPIGVFVYTISHPIDDTTFVHTVDTDDGVINITYTKDVYTEDYEFGGITSIEVNGLDVELDAEGGSSDIDMNYYSI